METRDGGETWHIVPGVFYSYSQGVYFSKTTDEVFLTGHSGTYIYDYNKFWEFLDSKITVMFNDKEISFSTMPEIVNGRAMVPMREIFELLGAQVLWDGETNTVTGKKKTTNVSLKLDSDSATINKDTVKLDVAPYLIDGRTMVPLRFISESLGINVGWDSDENIIIMKGS